MKRIALLSLFFVAIAGCGSSGSKVSSGPRAQLIEPEIEFRQIVGPPQLGYPTGQIEVKFEVRIGNRSGEPLTLRKLEVYSTNPEGGAYTVYRRSYFFNTTVGPDQTGSITMWAKAYGWGRGMRDSEPVTLHGIAYYDSPVGYLNQPFIKEIGQYPGQNDG
jgi:hypothetical protein